MMKLELMIVQLLAENTEKRFTINEIAKVLKQYYSFVHRTVNKLAKDGIILRDKAGKSWLCTLNTKNEKAITLIQLGEIEKRDEFLRENKELKLVMDDFVKSAQENFHPISIVLFGSYAKATAAKESDIDLLIIAKGKAGIDRITREIYAKYGKELNAIVMVPNDFKKQKGKVLINEIIHSHYVIYGAEKFVSLAFKK